LRGYVNYKKEDMRGRSQPVVLADGNAQRALVNANDPDEFSTDEDEEVNERQQEHKQKEESERDFLIMGKDKFETL